MPKKFLILLIFLVLISSFVFVNITQANSGDNVSGFAYSSNIGWISFNSTNCDVDKNGFIDDSGICGGDNLTTPVIDYGVTIDSSTGLFSGYAWSSNIGSITFKQAELIGCPSGTCEASIDFATNQVSGWARACSVFQSGCSGALDPNRGGWDGWIKLRGTTQGGNPYGVNLNQTTNEFHDYSWGGDPDSDDEAVIGWISWNCAEGSASRTSICPPIGSSDYKVIYSPSSVPNNNPTAESLSQNDISPCFPSTIATGRIDFSWTYKDELDGDPESRYELQIDTDSNFNAPRTVEIDCSGGCLGQTASPHTDTDGIDVKYGPGPGELNYGTTYYWRVKVYDNQGGDSGWVYPAPLSFSTPQNALPEPSFTISNATPAVGEIVTFDDNSSTCESGNCLYEWDFNGDGLTDYSSTVKGTTTHTYTVADEGSTYQVGLRMTDKNINKDCSASAPIYIGPAVPPRPEWKEIPPFGSILKQTFSFDSLKNVFAYISNFFRAIL